jgi:hypothetical protein
MTVCDGDGKRYSLDVNAESSCLLVDTADSGGEPNGQAFYAPA